MSLIEQAAKRLDELRRAGVEVPDAGAPPVPAGARSPGPSAVVAPPPAAAAVASVPDTPVMGHIDLARLAALGFVTPDNPRSRTADEFRIIKRPLIANAADPHIARGNLIMVTSALPGEGKTFSALNLAMSIAMELDRTVLLVDADVARPRLPQTLGLPEGKGLLDVLADRSLDLARVLVKTNVEKLTFLPSGRPHPKAAEMLASEGMAELLDEIARRYEDRIVIFDSPPLLVTTESRVLASRMGQVVFVIHADHTLQGDVTKALATIEACPVKLVLLNRARTASQGTYGYGYGYGN